jgi:hypothetical protein
VEGVRLAEFSASIEMEKVAALAEEFYRNVLRDDEEPQFVSDEAASRAQQATGQGESSAR